MIIKKHYIGPIGGVTIINLGRNKKEKKDKKKNSSFINTSQNKISNYFQYLPILLVTAPPRAAPVFSPETLLQEVLTGIQNGTQAEKLASMPINRLLNYVEQYYEKFKKDPNNTHNLELAKAFINWIYLIDPDRKDQKYEKLFDAVMHAWLEYIPKSIKAARPIKSIPGEVMERLAIPIAQPTQKSEKIIQLPPTTTTAKPILSEVEEFNEEDLKNAKYNYNIAEFSFVMRDYSTTNKFLLLVLETQYMNMDANNLLIQNSILWSEEVMQKNNFIEALDILQQIKQVGIDSYTADLINDKIKEATVLHKLALLEDKCPLNERAVGLFLRKNIGYKRFLKLTYYIFGNIEFHQRLEEIRIFPKKMIYPLLEREPSQRTEELLVKRHEKHDKLIRELYSWFWSLDAVKYYLPKRIKQILTEKFGEYGSGPVIYFRYISKGQYANIIISKAVALAGQGDIQKAKNELFQTYELTGSKKIKGYLDFLRRHEKGKKEKKGIKRKNQNQPSNDKPSKQRSKNKPTKKSFKMKIVRKK